MAVDILVPLGAFAMFVRIAHFLARLIATAILNRTIHEALRSHPDSVALLADRLEARQP